MENNKKTADLAEKSELPKKKSVFEAERARRMHAYSRAVKRMLRDIKV